MYHLMLYVDRVSLNTLYNSMYRALTDGTPSRAIPFFLKKRKTCWIYLKGRKTADSSIL